MDKQTRQYIKSMKAWIETQKNSIKSCEIIIKHLKEHIELMKNQIKLESKERLLKMEQVKEAERLLLLAKK